MVNFLDQLKGEKEWLEIGQAVIYNEQGAVEAACDYAVAFLNKRWH
jgi:hypothetical protein